MATEGQMTEDDPTEQLVVFRSHLEEIANVLHMAYGHHAAQDLADNYRAGRPNVKSSRLTTLIERAQQRVQGYLNSEFSINEPL